MARDLDPKLVDEAVNTIRMLAVDGVEAAGCGHPGAPMGLADITFELWTQHLRYDPKDPAWPNRDRFVLSAGHASMLLYGMLHLSGYEDTTLDQLKNFRQWGSKTPGHPEVGHTAGVETTTGPLGQGIANAVGMAASLKMLAARFNPHEKDLFTARVFGIASDGDLMEGLSHETCSLAGHLGLDNLVFFYDDNGITIDGETSIAFSEDIPKRFESYGWHVLSIDGHDRAQIRSALDKAVAESERPTLIVAKTHIGFGSPNRQDKSKAHGEKLGAEEVKLTKEALGWPLEPTFRVTDEVRSIFAARAEDGAKMRGEWQQKLAAFEGRGGDAAELYKALSTRSAPDDLLTQLVDAVPEKVAATRNQSGVIQQRAAALVPSLVGGCADLTGSTKTLINDSGAIRKGNFEGRNLYFGVREHAMGAFANGLALSRSFIPYTATFLVFSDYMRPSMRLAALMRQQAVFVFTHDSVMLGEDGPTHQPVEHYWALRAIPNLDLVRPADARECAAAWTHAITRKTGPTSFALTRQGVPHLARPDGFDDALMLRGAYIIDESKGDPSAVIIATGSEVHVAVEAKKRLGAAGESVRVVSAPCWDQFEREDDSYKSSVLPAGVKRCSIELGITQPWRGVVGEGGLTIGHDDFGFSAPAKVIADKLRVTPDAVAERIGAWL